MNKSALQYRKFIDEPSMSDKTLLVSVEDLINTAFGTIEQNIVNFKLVQTVLHILARQMRLLEQDVEIKFDEIGIEKKPTTAYEEGGAYEDEQQFTTSSGESREEVAAAQGRDERVEGEERKGRSEKAERGERGERGGGKESARERPGDKTTSKDRDDKGGSKDRERTSRADKGGSKDRKGDRGAAKEKGADRDAERDTTETKDRVSDKSGSKEKGGEKGRKEGDKGRKDDRSADRDDDGGRGGGRDDARGGARDDTQGGGRDDTRAGGRDDSRGGGRDDARGGGRDDTRGGARGGQRGGEREDRGGRGGKTGDRAAEKARKGTPESGRSTATGRSVGREGSRTSITVTETPRKGKKGEKGAQDKILVVEKGPTTQAAGGRVARVGSIEVVTASQFALLEKAVNQLATVAGPLPMPALPDNERLRQDLAKGRASLSETMQAMQLNARVQAAEQGLTRMAGLLTQLAAAGALPEDMAGQIGQVRDELQQAVTAVADAVAGQGVDMQPGAPGMGPGGVGAGHGGFGRGPGGVGMGPGGAGMGPGGVGMGPGGAGMGPGGVGMGPGGVATGQGGAGMGPGGMRYGGTGPGGASTGTPTSFGGTGAESTGTSIAPGRKSVAIDPISTLPSVSSRPDSVKRGVGDAASGTASRASVAGGLARRPSEVPGMVSTAAGPGGAVGVTHPEMQNVLQIMRDELIKEISSMTTRATHSADVASNTSKSVADKLDIAMNIDKRISKLFSLTADYAEQLSGFDSGLTTQMASFQEQMSQMRNDLKGGLGQLEQANNNAETAAIVDLTERYEGLVIELDNTLHTHQSLTALQKQLSDELRSLVECVEMLREQKADRDEVLDGLRDKADITRLAGLLHEEDFAHARVDLEKRLEQCYDKFKKQDEVWLCALKDLTGVTESKAEIIQLLAIKDTATEELKNIQATLRQLFIMLGEPKAAMLMRLLAKGAACGSCLAPALMEPSDLNYGKPFPLPPLRPPPLGEEGPCQTSLKPLPPPDARHHVCRRWVGGSHTLMADNVTRERAHAGDLETAPTKRFTGYGTDGRLYMLEEELLPCLECNKLSTDEPEASTPLPTPTGGGGDQGGTRISDEKDGVIGDIVATLGTHLNEANSLVSEPLSQLSEHQQLPYRETTSSGL